MEKEPEPLHPAEEAIWEMFIEAEVKSTRLSRMLSNILASNSVDEPGLSESASQAARDSAITNACKMLFDGQAPGWWAADETTEWLDE